MDFVTKARIFACEFPMPKRQEMFNHFVKFFHMMEAAARYAEHKGAKYWSKGLQDRLYFNLTLLKDAGIPITADARRFVKTTYYDLHENDFCFSEGEPTDGMFAIADKVAEYITNPDLF